MTSYYTFTDTLQEARFLQSVADEVKSSTIKHGDLNSPHEAYAVLQEEVDEFWDLVKAQDHDYEHMQRELKQVAAMCLKTYMMLERKKKPKSAFPTCAWNKRCDLMLNHYGPCNIVMPKTCRMHGLPIGHPFVPNSREWEERNDPSRLCEK